MALKFSAWGDYAQRLPFDWMQDRASFSVALTVRLDTLDTPENQCAVSHRGTDGQFSLRKASTSNKWRASVTVPGGVFRTKDSTAAAVVDTTYRILFSWEKNDATGLRMWIDGTEQGTGTSTTTQTVNYDAGTNTEFFLGQQTASASNLKGNVEGVIVVADYLWTSDDVAALNWTSWPYDQPWALKSHVFYPCHEQLTTRIPELGRGTGNYYHFESANLFGTVASGGTIGKWEEEATSLSGSSGTGGAAAVDPSWTLFDTTTHPTTSTVETGLTNGTTYQFRVTAEDAAGNVSAPSEIVEATPQDVTRHTPREVFFYAEPSIKGVGTPTAATSTATALDASATLSSRQNAWGFESGDRDEVWRMFEPNANPHTTVKRTGAYSCALTPNGTNNGSVGFAKHDQYGAESDSFNLATAYVRAWINFNDNRDDMTNDEQIARFEDTAGFIKLELRTTNGGILKAYDYDGTLIGTGTKIMHVSFWYKLTVEINTGSNATARVWINGDLDIEGTGNLRTANNGWFHLGRYNNRNSQTYTMYVDDVCIDGATNPNDTKVVLMNVDSNGNYTGYTASAGNKNDCVDEVPQNGDADYVYTTTVNDVYTAGMESASSAGITTGIVSVKPMIFCRKDTTSSTPEMKIRTRVGTTDDDQTSFGSLHNTTYWSFSKFYVQNPDTSDGWTTSGLDSIECGPLSSNDTYEKRCTNAMVHVEVAE